MFQHQRPRGAPLWGLILAAGEGQRLQSYVQQLKGNALPKQYVNLIGRRSMLEHTFHRAEKLIPSEKILTIIARHHIQYREVRRQLLSRPHETVVVQPINKETGPGILLPLMFIYKRCPEAIITLFPSDHFILEEERFMNHVNLAVQAVKHDPTRIVLLAIEAHKPETEYGYVIPHEKGGGLCRFGTRTVSAFIEKPNVDLALELVMAGGLWNTMTMVFKLETLFELVRTVHPALYLNFCRILNAIGTTEEQQTVEDVYQLLEPVNFSKEIMERIARRHPKSVSVLPVRKVFWSDLGSPQRVLEVLGKFRQRRAQKEGATGSTDSWSRGQSNRSLQKRAPMGL
jgi:mannose-1-phosphate guanylyltransferase